MKNNITVYITITTIIVRKYLNAKHISKKVLKLLSYDHKLLH